MHFGFPLSTRLDRDDAHLADQRLDQFPPQLPRQRPIEPAVQLPQRTLYAVQLFGRRLHPRRLFRQPFHLLAQRPLFPLDLVELPVEVGVVNPALAEEADDGIPLTLQLVERSPQRRRLVAEPFALPLLFGQPLVQLADRVAWVA
jgi:hypothetical protein